MYFDRFDFSGYVWSLLYAHDIDSTFQGGETGFVDGCSLKDRLPDRLVHALRNKTLSQSFHNIPDFRR